MIPAERAGKANQLSQVQGAVHTQQTARTDGSKGTSAPRGASSMTVEGYKMSMLTKSTWGLRKTRFSAFIDKKICSLLKKMMPAGSRSEQIYRTLGERAANKGMAAEYLLQSSSLAEDTDQFMEEGYLASQLHNAAAGIDRETGGSNHAIDKAADNAEKATSIGRDIWDGVCFVCRGIGAICAALAGP